MTRKENFFFWAIILMVLFLFWVLLSSCNTPKHMTKVYPKGYWMHGQYLSNHPKPQKKTVFAK